MLHNYKGEMRKTNNQHYANKSTWDRQREFYPGSKQKYEKSQISYCQSQSSLSYEQPRSERPNKRLPGEQREYFDDNIPIKVKSTERQDYHTVLRVQIRSGTEKGLPYVVMHLTDDGDPLFLWSFQVKEGDFINLKNEQCLKVDFAGFPQMMESQLGLLRSEREYRPQQQEFFYSVFQIKKGGEGSLNILQSRKYKQTNHLSLKFKLATDEHIKSFLANKYNRERQENQDLVVRISELERALEERKKEYERLLAQRKEQETIYLRERQSLTRTEQERLERLKAQEEQKLQTKQRHLTEQILHKQDQFRRETNKLEKKFDQLTKEHKALGQKYHLLTLKHEKLQFTSQSNGQQLSKRNREVEQQNKELKQLRNNTSQQEKKIVELESNVLGFQRQLADKQEIIKARERLKENQCRELAAHQQKCKQLKETVEKFEKKYQQMQRQYEKERKQREDIKQKYQKRKDKNNQLVSIMKSQENHVAKLEAEVKEAQNKTRDLHYENDKTRNILKEIEKKNDDLKRALLKSNEDLEEKIKLVDHLNNKLNQKSSFTRHLVGGTTYPSSLSSILSSNSRDLPNIGESRLKYPGISNLNADTSDRGTRIDAPVVKRYKGSTPIKGNEGRQEGDRTLSPSMARLNQQTDPEDDLQQPKTKRIQPVKFKFGQ